MHPMVTSTGGTGVAVAVEAAVGVAPTLVDGGVAVGPVPGGDVGCGAVVGFAPTGNVVPVPVGTNVLVLPMGNAVAGAWGEVARADDGVKNPMRITAMPSRVATTKPTKMPTTRPMPRVFCLSLG
jgi:hypothetical protein